MNAKEYRRRWKEAESSADRYAKQADEWKQRAFRAENAAFRAESERVNLIIQLDDVKMHRANLEAKLESIMAADVVGREIWRARAEAAEAKLSAAREFVAEANEEFTKAAAEDAAMVERFNG